jgi:uncharacterized protein
MTGLLSMGRAQPMLHFAKHSEQALLHYLTYLGNRDAVLNYQQIHGLLYAMASSPEPIKPAEWFELIWLSDDPHFDDATQAKTFYQLLVELSRHIGELARRDLYRPGVDGSGAFSPDALADWCDGFLIGHQYLENVWVMALDDLDDDELCERVEAVLDWAVTFVERDTGAWPADDADDNLVELQLQFQQLLSAYYGVHELWYRGAYRWDVERLFEGMQMVDREDPCPCGSGRPFRQCCLH